MYSYEILRVHIIPRILLQEGENEEALENMLRIFVVTAILYLIYRWLIGTPQACLYYTHTNMFCIGSRN
jgi:hypothetical protein